MVNSRSAGFPSALALLAVLLASGGCGRAGGAEEALVPPAGPKTAEGMPQAGPGEFVSLHAAGESLEGAYEITLTECLSAGRLAFQAQKIRLTRQEQFSAWAAIDGRWDDATPVRVKAEDTGEKTKVLFTVGTRKNDFNKAGVKALKEAFEAHVLVADPSLTPGTGSFSGERRR
jgi:hypothetical protein